MTGILAVSTEYGWRGIQIINVIFLEPCQHLVKRMPGFMRIVILISNPDRSLAFVADARAYDEINIWAEQTNQFGADQRRQSRRPIIEANHDNAAGFEFFDNGCKGAPGIECVVQHAVGYDDIKAVVLDRQIENIHLREGCPGQGIAPLVLNGEAEACQRHVDAQHVIVVELKIVRELTGAATAFKNGLVVADGIKQVFRKTVVMTFRDQLAEFFQPFVTWKRIFFIKRADPFGDILAFAGTRREQGRDAVNDRESFTGFRAPIVVTIFNQMRLIGCTRCAQAIQDAA